MFGAEYKNASSVQYAIASKAIDTLPPSNSVIKIIDVGCGDGKVTAKLAAKFTNANILGTDISNELIELAQQDYTTEKLHFAIGNATNISDTQEYDMLFSFFCLHLIPEDDLPKTIANLFSALKPNGELYIMIPMRDETLSTIRNRVMKEFQNELGNYRLSARKNGENYISLFKAMGNHFDFDVIQENKSSFDPELSQKSFEEFFTGIARERRILANETSKKSYIKRIAEEMPKKPNGGINFQFEYCTIHYKLRDNRI